MAECGIEKYDKLPARAGWTDIDYLRWRLWRCNNPSFISRIPILGWLLTPPSDEKTKQNIINKLERFCTRNPTPFMGGRMSPIS